MNLIEQMKKAGMKLKPNHLTPREKAIRMLELKAQWAQEAEKAKNKTNPRNVPCVPHEDSISG